MSYKSEEMKTPLLEGYSSGVDPTGVTIPPVVPQSSTSEKRNSEKKSRQFFKIDFSSKSIFTLTKFEDETKNKSFFPSKYSIKEYWKSNGLELIMYSIWTIINIILFFEAMHRYYKKGANTFVMFARGGGQLLNYNCALILLPVLRNVLTRLRRTFLHNLFPWDSNLNFHRRIAFVIVMAGILHGTMHYFNYHIVAQNNSTGIAVIDMEWNLAFRTRAGATGHFLVLVMILMYTSSIHTFKRPHFNVFFLTHHLFIVFFALLLAHGPNFWKWFIGPAFFYMVERIAREWRGKRNVRVISSHAHPSDVLELRVQKKRRFIYQAGQYLFLNCPYLSRYEWHPFTITTAPENNDYVSVHIRCVGPWTKRLREVMNPHNEAYLEINKTYGPDGQHLVRIDGPFGSASEDVFRFSTVILVGAGIGVTPFASILRSIVNRMRGEGKTLTLKTVYFFWICRDYSAFEWFRDLLKEIEVEAKQRNFNLQLNIFCTGKVEDVYKQVSEDGCDPITHLESKTNYGRPNWEEIFEEIRKHHNNQTIGTFFCGPKELSVKMRKTCAEFSANSKVHGCTFVFHKENF